MDSAVKAVLARTPVVPVITIDRVEDAVPLAEALISGGIPVLEITLRTAAGLESIHQIKAAFPDASVGAGTVLNATDLANAKAAGADFIVSPGLTPDFLAAGLANGAPLLPGVATVSEIMLGLEAGLQTFKFFPAEANGGVPVLKAFAGPFGAISFCPTGGISLNNAASYLALPSVLSVGGSWLCPTSLIDKGDWSAIQQLASEAATLGEPQT